MYITVYNDKGGTGKSTFVREIALYMERYGKKPLIVDLDYKNSITKSFDIDKADNVEALLETRTSINTALTSTKYVDIIPGSYGIKKCEIKNTIRENIKFIEDDYDFILIDTSGENIISDMAIYQSDIIVVPVVADTYNIFNLSHTIEHIKKTIESGQKIYTLITKVDDEESTLGVIEEIGAICSRNNVEVFETMIREDETVKMVQAKGKELRSYDFVSDAAEDYKLLTEEFVSKTELFMKEIKIEREEEEKISILEEKINEIASLNSEV